MRRINKNIKYLLLIIAFAIALYAVSQNFGALLSLGGFVIGVAFPFILGIFFAFLLNLPMSKFESLFMKSRNKIIRKIARPVSLLLSFICLLSVLSVVALLVVPELIKAGVLLGENLQKFYGIALEWFTENSSRFDFITDFTKYFDINWSTIAGSVTGFARTALTGLVTSFVNMLTSIVGGTINFFVAIVVAVYIVLTKDTLKRHGNKVLCAFVPLKAARYIKHVYHVAKYTFSRYVVGQCTEALILGTVCALGMTVLGLPFAGTVGAMLSVFCFIPIVGLVIAVGISFFLIAMQSPVQALIFLLFYLVLQQIEGNFVYPRVVGSAIGISPLIVLSAIFLGGGLFGIVGMVLAVPTASVIYKLISELVNKRLKKKQAAGERLLLDDKPSAVSSGDNTPEK